MPPKTAPSHRRGTTSVKPCPSPTSAARSGFPTPVSPRWRALLGAAVAPARFARRIVDDLAERIWRAALPTASNVPGVRLRDAVEAGGGPEMWPEVIAALLDGRINAFRRRGGFAGPILAALVVSSERVVAELAPTSEAAGEAPFIWTPTIAN
jgi:hypothetical protein